uniref:Uncharacterized protein n=1 Tax=Ditylenchus dipsaci TaxID=166011 RepID=A0A915CZT5_9BILA
MAGCSYCKYTALTSVPLLSMAAIRHRCIKNTQMSGRLFIVGSPAGDHVIYIAFFYFSYSTHLFAVAGAGTLCSRHADGNADLLQSMPDPDRSRRIGCQLIEKTKMAVSVYSSSTM